MKTIRLRTATYIAKIEIDIPLTASLQTVTSEDLPEEFPDVTPANIIDGRINEAADAVAARLGDEKDDCSSSPGEPACYEEGTTVTITVHASVAIESTSEHAIRAAVNRIIENLGTGLPYIDDDVEPKATVLSVTLQPGTATDAVKPGDYSTATADDIAQMQAGEEDHFGYLR